MLASVNAAASLTLSAKAGQRRQAFWIACCGVQISVGGTVGGTKGENKGNGLGRVVGANKVIGNSEKLEVRARAREWRGKS
jgi:hypothetical protein